MSSRSRLLVSISPIKFLGDIMAIFQIRRCQGVMARCHGLELQQAVHRPMSWRSCRYPALFKRLDEGQLQQQLAESPFFARRSFSNPSRLRGGRYPYGNFSHGGGQGLTAARCVLRCLPLPFDSLLSEW